MMKNRIIYIALFLVLIALVFGPALYNDKFVVWNSEDELKSAAETGEGGYTVVPAQPAALPAESSPSTAGGATGPGNLDSRAGQGNGAAAGTPAVTVETDKKEVGCVVDVAVVGMGGELLFGPAEVALKNAWSDTPLGALDATGVSYKTSAGFGGFVEEVAGQRNKGQSGWMYKVNDEIPMVAADEKKLENGDQVIWWYSKGIGTPEPDWEEIGKKQNPE